MPSHHYGYKSIEWGAADVLAYRVAAAVACWALHHRGREAQGRSQPGLDLPSYMYMYRSGTSSTGTGSNYSSEYRYQYHDARNCMLLLS